MTKQAIVDKDWNVSSAGLDPIEIHLLSKAYSTMGHKNPARQVEITEIARALGIELIYQAVVEGEKVSETRDPYRRIDGLYGPGYQDESPCPETDREAHFIEVDGSWILSTMGLSAVEYNIIHEFADTAIRFHDVPRCREKNEKAAYEVARRLGLKPVLHKTPTE